MGGRLEDGHRVNSEAGGGGGEGEWKERERVGMGRKNYKLKDIWELGEGGCWLGVWVWRISRFTGSLESKQGGK